MIRRIPVSYEIERQPAGARRVVPRQEGPVEVNDARLPEETLPPSEVPEEVPADATASTAVEEGQRDFRELYLRAAADMANFRRRTEVRAEEQVEGERRRLLGEFLEFADNLERALAALPSGYGAGEKPALRRGVQLTWEGLRRFLEREGVEPIEAEGRPFDPTVHEAVATMENGREPGTVIQEVQKGYLYRGRLLRPARVVVSQ